MCGCGYGFSLVQIHPPPSEYGSSGVNGCVVRRGGRETLMEHRQRGTRRGESCNSLAQGSCSWEEF